MATKQQIIQAVKKVIGNQIIDAEYLCPKCNVSRIFKLNLSKGIMTCSACGEQLEIDENSYLNIYEQLRKIGAVV